MRVTTNGSLMGYRSDLMRSSSQLNSARNKVLTQRNFNSYAEDPAAATQAFKLRRLYSRTADQIDTSTATINKFESAWTSAGTVKNLLEQAAKDVALRAGTDSTASGRQPLGEVLDTTAKSIVQSLNAQYADTFIFGGSNADAPPFSWSQTGGLLFQGQSVDDGMPGAPTGTPPNPSDVSTTSDWGVYYAANPDYAKLAQMTHETTYLDVGTGLKEDGNNNLISSSAFNSSISGLALLGFGKDADGDPKNAVSLIMELSKILKGCDPDSGAYADTTNDPENVRRLTSKLESSLASLTNKWVELDGQSKYLTVNKDRLTATSDTLNEQILSLEQVDLADALTDYSWAQYCYNAALKVGNSILSQSLIDYMN